MSGETRERRLREIKVALESKPYARVPVQAAKNLYRLLQEAKDKGHLKRDIANLAWTGNGQDPEYNAKQLSRVILSPDAPRDSETKLDKKPANYIAVAKAWAQLMGRSEDEALFRVFADTEFGSGLIDLSDDDYDPWVLLANGLRSCALHVIRLHQLEKYFKKVQSATGRYDARYGFLPARQSVWISLGGLALSATCSDEVQPVPSVRLARRLQCEPVKGSIWFDPNVCAATAKTAHAPYLSNVGIALGANALTGIEPVEFGKTGDMEKKDCIYRLWLDVRLAAGPAFAYYDIMPLIEIRTNLEFEIDGEIGILDNPYTDGTDIVSSAYIKGKIHRVALDAPDDFPTPFRSASFDQTEHTYFAWAPLELTN